jgi:hypothetical protein
MKRRTFLYVLVKLSIHLSEPRIQRIAEKLTIMYARTESSIPNIADNHPLLLKNITAGYNPKNPELPDNTIQFGPLNELRELKKLLESTNLSSDGIDHVDPEVVSQVPKVELIQPKILKFLMTMRIYKESNRYNPDRLIARVTIRGEKKQRAGFPSIIKKLKTIRIFSNCNFNFCSVSRTANVALEAMTHNAEQYSVNLEQPEELREDKKKN